LNLISLDPGSHANLRDKCAIVGVGHSRLGRVSEVSSTDLLVEAIKNALDDSGVDLAEVDGLICRGPHDIYCHHQVIGARLGIDARFSTTLDNGGAGQILSVILAVLAIQAGMARTVICGCSVDSWSRTHHSEDARIRNETRPEQRPKEFALEYGYTGAPAAHAFGAQRHMDLYGTTRDQFAEIAIAFREHAQSNPDAMMRAPLTLDEYRKARLIVAPFGLYDCSLRSDGAGAVIVTSSERARDLKERPVLIKGFGTHNHLRGWFVDENMVETSAIHSGKDAYAMAGLGPRDIDVAQIYDCFTYMVLVQLEDLGFCRKGEGGAFVQSGALRKGGTLPCNTSGGQLSEAHVEGMLQICEGARQLRWIYPPARQVAGAEIALVTGHGGNQVCHSTLILGRG
jgi:acetyl-CoA acetyltransferase